MAPIAFSSLRGCDRTIYAKKFFAGSRGFRSLQRSDAVAPRRRSSSLGPRCDENLLCSKTAVPQGFLQSMPRAPSSLALRRRVADGRVDASIAGARREQERLV